MKKLIKGILPEQFFNFFKTIKNESRIKKEREIEQNSAEFILRRKFYSQFLKIGDTYFDIGANYGNRIGPIKNIGIKKIIAVEPQVGCCEYLKDRYKDITVIQKGVGASLGSAKFYISNDTVLSSFSNDFIAKTSNTRFTDNSWDNTTEIEIITLDSLIEEYGMPDFIKIDVEGFELEVFKGLSVPLKIVSFEYTVPELSDNLLPIIEKLASLGVCTFNYSIGETMVLHLSNWVNNDEIKTILNSENFINTGFGDIYAKFI